MSTLAICFWHVEGHVYLSRMLCGHSMRTGITYILLNQDYKICNCYSNKNTDGLVNMLANNLVILNQAHRVAWLIG